MKHILLIDLSFAGHHTIYLEKIARAYLATGCEVTIATLDTHIDHTLFADLSIEFHENFRSSFISDRSKFELIRPYSGNLGREFINRSIFKSIYRKITA